MTSKSRDLLEIQSSNPSELALTRDIGTNQSGQRNSKPTLIKSAKEREN
jgi:hypothetical protein